MHENPFPISFLQNYDYQFTFKDPNSYENFVDNVMFNNFVVNFNNNCKNTCKI